jgi:hypothetical protein
METMTMKRCSRCKQEKPRTEFGEQQSKKDGLHPYCRECNRAYQRERRMKNAARNPDEIVTPSEKRCPGCGITRPSSEWPGNRTRSDGLAPYCKSCTCARGAKYRAENGEKYRESMRRWREANPEKNRAKVHRRRARKANAFTIPHSHDDLLDYWRFVGVDPEKCWFCFLEGRDSPAEEIDHLKPLAAGGSETPWNKRPACSRCNRWKNDRVFPAGGGDEEAMRIAREQANLTHMWMMMHNLID